MEGPEGRVSSDKGPILPGSVLVLGVRRLESADRRRQAGEWRWKRSVRKGGARLLRDL